MHTTRKVESDQGEVVKPINATVFSVNTPFPTRKVGCAQRDIIPTVLSFLACHYECPWSLLLCCFSLVQTLKLNFTEDFDFEVKYGDEEANL